jgi:acetyl/propionyl-CoA carboxylase alpha subunit
LPANVPWLIDLLNHDAMRAGHASTQTANEVAQTMPDHKLAVAAAVAHTLDRPRSATSDPWTAIGPLRLSGTATLMFHGDDWEERLGVRPGGSGWELVRDGIVTPLRWWRDELGIWTVSLGDDIGRFGIAVDDDTIEVAGNGGRWLMQPGQRPSGESTRRQRTSDGRIRAPLPAKVLLIHASEGDHVEAGQPLVTLSAMKIELICEAPVAGTVESINCKVDQLVDAGDLLVGLKGDDG